MVSKRVILVLTAVVSGTIILGALLIQFQLQPRTSNERIGVRPSAVLRVNAYVLAGYWTRNVNTDLPDYISTIEYSVSNTGNAQAENVNVTVYTDGNLYTTYIIPSLAVSQANSSSFSTSTAYDSRDNVKVQASCQDFTDSQAFSVGSNLPRYWSEPGISELYVTPKEVNLVGMENAILRDKFFLIPNWIALRDWVGNNIKYRYDNETHGVGDYWQLSKETLELRTGDCEDYAILLCSLFRADGWSPNDVYVVLGTNGEAYHGWVKINFGILGWYNIEPQGNGWNTLIGDFLSLSGFTAKYVFNDQQYMPAK